MTPYKLKGCYIAGGAITSHVTKKEIADYDVYPKDIESRNEAIMELCDNGYILTYTYKAVTIITNDIGMDGRRQIYQIMILDDGYKSAHEIFELFDFTVCMGAYDCDTKEYIYHDSFLLDNASRTLKFNSKTRFPFASLLRTIKYQKKGYVLPKVEFCKMIFTVIENGGPKNWKDVESALGGFYGSRVTFAKNTIQENSNDDIDDELGFNGKIQEQELEFNYENLMMVLDKQGEDNFEYQQPDELEGHGINPEELIDILDPRDRYYHLIPNNNQVIIFDENMENGYFRNMCMNAIDEIKEKENWKELPENILVKTFKCFRKTDDPNILKPVSENAKDMDYHVDKLTVVKKSPYMYVGKKFQDAAGYMNNYSTKKGEKEIREVYFTLKDIKNSDSVSFQVDRLVVSDVIEEDDQKSKTIEIVDNPTSLLYN